MRYNIFNKVHLPLKTALITGCITIDKIMSNEAFFVADALQKVEEVLEVFAEQTTYEGLHICPFIFEYEPSVWNNYSAEHQKASRLAENLNELVHLCYRQKKQNDKLKIMRQISESYNDFMLFNFNHMDDEEAVLTEILWRYYADGVLKAIEENMNILPHLSQLIKQAAGLQIAAAA